MKLNGYSTLKEKEVGYIECVKCGYYNTWFNVSDGKTQCPQCKHVHESNPNIRDIIEKSVECSECSENIPIIPENRLNSLFYMCYNCENIVAVVYDDEIHQPLAPLKNTSNFKSFDEWIKIEDNLYFVICNNKKVIGFLKYSIL